jgi:hypothetical protein
MSDDYQDGVLFPMKIKQHGRDYIRRITIEVPSRLIAQQQRRLSNQSPREGNSLTFTTRQLGRTMIDTVT